ncbi:MAG TPA: EamA family transporter, partial [Chloroflexia bacterium]|nr:EamA family transporter [Chloroflexia bacterium]
MATDTLKAKAAGATGGSRAGIALAMLSIYLIWGSTYLGIRIALEGFPPFLMGAIRFLVAGAILYIFSRMQGVSSATRTQWKNSAIIGGLLLVGGNGGVSFAEQWITSGLAAVWIATMPLWAALFAGLWGRWPNRLEWLGLGMGLVGVGLLNFEKNLQANPIG